MKRTNEASMSTPPIAATTACRNKAALRSLLASVSIALAFAATPAGAVDEHHPETAAGSTPAAGAISTPEAGPAIAKMQENVSQMRSQLERAANAKTDEERRTALADHMRTMQANMMLGRSMLMGAAGGYPAMGAGTGPGMMGPGMMCPGMMATMGCGAPDSVDLQRMERRLDMMQMMMEQLMRSRTNRSGAAPSKAR